MYEDVLQHLRWEAKQEEKRPKCDHCGNAIWDDELVDIECKLYCLECARQLFVRDTDDYMLEE